MFNNGYSPLENIPRSVIQLRSCSNSRVMRAVKSNFGYTNTHKFYNAFLTDSQIEHSVHNNITKSVGDTALQRTAQTGCKLGEWKNSVVFTVVASILGTRRGGRGVHSGRTGPGNWRDRSPPCRRALCPNPPNRLLYYACAPMPRFTTRSIQATPVLRCFFCFVLTLLNEGP